jgi:hypothetical protein
LADSQSTGKKFFLVASWRIFSRALPLLVAGDKVIVFRLGYKAWFCFDGFEGLLIRICGDAKLDLMMIDDTFFDFIFLFRELMFCLQVRRAHAPMRIK